MTTLDRATQWLDEQRSLRAENAELRRYVKELADELAKHVSHNSEQAALIDDARWQLKREQV